MKKVLIMIEDIMEGNSTTDVLLEIAISIKEQQQKVSLFIENAQGGDVAERLRIKGIPVFDLMHGCYATMEKKYDAILAFDDWSISKASLFEGKDKIKVSASSDPENIIDRILDFEEDEEVDDEDEEIDEISDEEKIAKTAELVQCQKCGSDNTPDAVVCNLCGDELPGNGSHAPAKKTARKTGKKKKATKKKASKK